MNNIFSRMAAVALTMWLGFAAGTVNADIVAVNPWSPLSPPGERQASFSNTPTTDLSGSFTDFIYFNVPGPGSSGDSFAGEVSASSGMSFSSFKLFAWLSSPLPGAITGSALATGSTFTAPFDQVYITFSVPTVPGDYAFELSGSNPLGGQYTGQVAIAAVPEPETYAMLLIGLGLLGFTARRRNII